MELLGGFPPTGINFDSATQLAKTKNHPAGWFPFWSCWADSNRRPHPYQKAVAAFMAFPFMQRKNLQSLVLQGLEVLLVLVRFITYRGALRGFRVFVGKIVGKPCRDLTETKRCLKHFTFNFFAFRPSVRGNHLLFDTAIACPLQHVI